MESIFILLINIVAFYLYDWIIQSYAEKYEKELLERQLECYTNQIRIIELSQSKIKSLQHDIKHHFLQLGDMATKNDNEEILRYLEEMKLSIKNTMEYVSTGNAGIDTILNYMIGEAKKLTDNVMVKVQIPEHIILNQFDINVILSNLLENAISALREVEDKKLNITIKYDKGTLYILIQNNYRGVIKNRYGNLITSKDNNEFHGIGLSNVQKMVDKYNGILNIEYDDLFTAEVLLYLTL
jgi:sensor histidine kinase YesM